MGEADSDVCGDRWLTWGLPDEDDAEEDEAKVATVDDLAIAAPACREGFYRVNVDREGDSSVDSALGATQICRSDSSAACGFSRCVSFRRKGDDSDGSGGGDFAS